MADGSNVVVGIDLGTTNSLVAYMQGDTPMVIPGADGERLMPSVVAWTDDGVAVGNAARATLMTDSGSAIYSAKRLMGRDLADVAEELKLFPFRLAEDAKAGEVLRLNVGWVDADAARGLGLRVAAIEAQCRAIFRFAGNSGGDHRAGLLQRRTAPGDQGCGAHCRA